MFGVYLKPPFLYDARHEHKRPCLGRRADRLDSPPVYTEFFQHQFPVSAQHPVSTRYLPSSLNRVLDGKFHMVHFKMHFVHDFLLGCTMQEFQRARRAHPALPFALQPRARVCCAAPLSSSSRFFACGRVFISGVLAFLALSWLPSSASRSLYAPHPLQNLGCPASAQTFYACARTPASQTAQSRTTEQRPQTPPRHSVTRFAGTGTHGGKFETGPTPTWPFLSLRSFLLSAASAAAC